MIKEKIKNFVKKLKDYDNIISNYNDNNYDNNNIDVKVARCNYEMYQEDLRQRQQNYVTKWCNAINKASRNGNKYFNTNSFVVDPDDKDKILYIVTDGGCEYEFPSNSSVQHLKQYFEKKGFGVTIMESPYMYGQLYIWLRISWIDED